VTVNQPTSTKPKTAPASEPERSPAAATAAPDKRDVRDDRQADGRDSGARHGHDGHEQRSDVDFGPPRPDRAAGTRPQRETAGTASAPAPTASATAREPSAGP
jgi:hypothetical protein